MPDKQKSINSNNHDAFQGSSHGKLVFVNWKISIRLSVSFCFVLFDLILYVQSTIFQLYRDGSSWVEPVLS